MNLRIQETSPAHLENYGEISIAYECGQVMDVLEAPGDPPRLVEREMPFSKDYDRLEPPEEWRWNTRNWCRLDAYLGGERVGACLIARDTPGLEMLDGREDLAVLWDIRVAAAHRGRRIGSALVARAERWAARLKCCVLRVETQSVNAPACRFYAKLGFSLTRVNRSAYPTLPDEVQLIWEKRIGA